MFYQPQSANRLEEKEKVSILLEDEKKRATEQAKLLEMDLEVLLTINFYFLKYLLFDLVECFA